MKKIFPYLFLITLSIPQFMWIERCASIVKADKMISILVEIEDITEDNENSESDAKSENEKEGKKIFCNQSALAVINVKNIKSDGVLSHYINHYDFLYSTFTLFPPEFDS